MKLILFLLSFFVVSQSVAQSSIADARKKNLGETVTVTGMVTNGSELGLIKYIQDTHAGIAVYDSKLENLKRGDSITVTGQLADYNNLLEIKSVSSLEKHSSGNDLPVPILLTINDIGEDYESRLIRINNVQFTSASGLFYGGVKYPFTDGTNTGEIYISNGSQVIGKPIPSGKFHIVAICSQYSNDNNNTSDGYQLIPRTIDDLISASSVNITSSVFVNEITKQSLVLSWQTDIASNAFVRYGDTQNTASLIHTKEGDSTVGEEIGHFVEITGLNTAQVIYAQVFNVNGNDTAFSAINAYVSESNSSGVIRVYFNTTVDESLAAETIANDIGQNMEDTLAAYINQAEETIDFCIYNFDNNTISSALNAAESRGVKIRLITCGSTDHNSVGGLNPGIAVLERPDEEYGIMHNKFAIFDGKNSNANKAWVWSGSTNLTQNQLLFDANNMIFIQDQSLAITYKIEFEEMWGGADNQPSQSTAKFGADKVDNTPHELLIGGNRVECYFSPSDNTNQKIIDAMATADEDLNVQTMLITRNDLANAIVEAYNSGVEVNVVTDDEKDNTDAVNEILNELPGNKFVFDEIASGMLHHKMAIIDATSPTSDPQVLSGSHNWSNSANTRNDENTLIIHDAIIANQYYQQLAYRFEQNGGDLTVSAGQIEVSDIQVFPNPTAKKLHITSGEMLHNIRVFSIDGKLVYQLRPTTLHQRVEIDLSDKKSGLYLLEIELDNNKRNTYKVLKK